MSPAAPQNALAQLVALAREVSFAPGARLVRQGEPSRGAFLVREGAAEARVALPGGGTHAVARFGAGDMFGEMALVERGACTASVVALEPLSGWFVGRDDFRARVASRDPAALAIQREVTRVLAGKLRAVSAKLREHPAAEDRAAAPAAQAGSPAKAPLSYDWRAFLPILPFFEGFDADEVAQVAALGTPFALPRGAGLFRAGEGADACYLVLRGALEVYTVRGSAERRLAVMGPGELVGYMALVHGARRGNHARAREACALLELPAEAFLSLYNGDSAASVSLHHALHRTLMRALGRTNTQLTRLISAARLRGAHEEGRALEAARSSQIDVVPTAA